MKEMMLAGAQQICCILAGTIEDVGSANGNMHSQAPKTAMADLSNGRYCPGIHRLHHGSCSNCTVCVPGCEQSTFSFADSYGPQQKACLIIQLHGHGKLQLNCASQVGPSDTNIHTYTHICQSN